MTGISVESWRVAIGSFNLCRYQKVKKIHTDSSNKFYSHIHDSWIIFIYWCLKFWRTFSNNSVQLVYYCYSLLLLIQILLLCSGVHPNPGPVGQNEYCDLSLCHANVRSLKVRNKDGLLEKFEYIKCNLSQKYDIITVSETWLSETFSSDNILLGGYQEPFRLDRHDLGTAAGYGGVLAWVSSSIACKRRQDFEIPLLEAMWLEIRTNNNKFFLCVTYRRPNMRNYWELLQSSLDTVREIDGAKILITGDLNADPSTPEGSNLYEFTVVNGLVRHIDQPTRILLNSQTILDQFISNFPQMIKATNVLTPVGTSDHCVIAARLLFRRRKHLAYKRVMWEFSKTDFSSYREAIHNYDWDSCFVSEDIDVIAESWSGKLLEIAKAHIPNKEVTIRPDDKPWYNNRLRLLCRKKIRLYKLFKRNKTDFNWNNFKAARNHYTSELATTKATYEKEKYRQLENHSQSPKKWWSLIRSVQKTNDAFESIPPIHVGDNIITHDKEKADAFNEFFLSASTLDDQQADLPDAVGVLEGGLHI